MNDQQIQYCLLILKSIWMDFGWKGKFFLIGASLLVLVLELLVIFAIANVIIKCVG